MAYTLLLTAPYMLPSLERFRPIFEKHRIDLIIPPVEERMEEPDLLAYAGQFDAAICGDDRYTARVLEACVPRLKVISKWGTGVDSIDAQACTRLNVKLFRTADAFTEPVADTVLGYMLAFARRGPWMAAQMKSGKWEKIPGRALNECTLGVIGVGNIGKAVTRRARAFGMKVYGTDVVPIDADFIRDSGIEMTDLRRLLAESDFVSINCDLTPSAHHLLNASTLGRERLAMVVQVPWQVSLPDAEAPAEQLELLFALVPVAVPGLAGSSVADAVVQLACSAHWPTVYRASHRRSEQSRRCRFPCSFRVR